MHPCIGLLCALVLRDGVKSELYAGARQVYPELCGYT